MEWDLGDGTITRDPAPRHAYKDFGDYVIRLNCTDASGTVARSIFFVRVERTIDPKEPLMQTGFEEKDFEEWGHLWDRGPSRGEFTYFPEKREDGDGFCMCVSNQGTNRTLATNVKLRLWNIDKYPFIKLSYRIPPDVPVGIWLKPWPAANRPANSPGKFISQDKYKLVDDGKWHQIIIDARDIRKDIPGLNLIYSFEFGTYAQSKEGQKFWFDDFVITP